MTNPFSIVIDDKQITDALSGLSAKVSDMSKPMREIGELMVLSTRERFGSSTGPDGVKWAPNSASTLEAWLRAKGSAHDKDGNRVGWKKGWLRQDGRVSAKAGAALAGKKPLVASGDMASSITMQVTGNILEWGVPVRIKQGNVMQFGAKKGAFGPRTPWGDIPARPYLGLSDFDRVSILGVIERYLALS